MSIAPEITNLRRRQPRSATKGGLMLLLDRPLSSIRDPKERYGQTMSRHEFNPYSKKEQLILQDAKKFEACVFKGVKDLRRGI